MSDGRPRIVIVATGGTIAGAAESMTAAGYTSGSRRPRTRTLCRNFSSAAEMRRLSMAAIAALAVVFLPATASAQRADLVTLANGDRITGEVVALERGRLQFKTDDAGTLYLEWDNLASVVTKRLVELETRDGLRYFGTLAPAPARALTVARTEGDVPLPMADVTWIAPIGRSFWRKLDGSFDVGFNYTQSSGIGTLTVNADTKYRKRSSEARVTASATLTRTDGDSERDDRGTLDLSWRRHPWQQWFVLGVGRFESNESLGLTLRSQVGVALGPRLVNSNRAQLSLAAGISVNDERGVDVESTRNVEGIFLFQWSYFTYDRPTTNLDVRVQYYPSLSDPGRQRVQLDTNVKRELLPDFFVALTLYNSYDNRPPNALADRNDVGVVASIGWSY